MKFLFEHVYLFYFSWSHQAIGKITEMLFFAIAGVREASCGLLFRGLICGMNCEPFFEKLNTYGELSEPSKNALQKILRLESCKRGEAFIRLGEIPTRVGFIVKGLIAQNYISESGDTVIKYFFPEGRFAASMGAMLAGVPSQFAVVALEDTKLLTYEFAAFKRLTEEYRDIAAFYIRYMEQHWIIEKEPLEISLRTDTAAKRYEDFVNSCPGLVQRLKKHQIASYLGITPTQFSRLFASQE